MTEQEAIDFCKNEPEAAAKIILMVEKLAARVKELEEKLSLNSNNSSKPPSTDNKLQKRKKTASSAKKKRGAQIGRSGTNLKLVATPDEIQPLHPSHCKTCQHSLEDEVSVKIEKRQLFDLPIIKMEVIEYQAHTKICPCCHGRTKASFPDKINATTQYGDKLKSFTNYCHSFQMIPYERISELIEDLVDHKISVGTIYNFLNHHYEQLELYEQKVKKQLIQAKVLHSDETGINIKGKLHWIHVASSKYLTLFYLHAKRGKMAMDDMEILPNYHGVLVHDHWKPYNHYDCQHAYCNAHLLRELTRISELEKVQWSEDMHQTLTQMNIAVHKAKNSDKEALSATKINTFTKRFEQICQNAQIYYPASMQNEVKKRGRPKQAKGKNLLDRLSKYQEETLRFPHDFSVPFTNNLAERDLRMVKVKEKISGTFASDRGGQIFCRLRGYISTLKKNGIAVLQGLRDALEGNAYIPCGVGC